MPYAFVSESAMRKMRRERVAALRLQGFTLLEITNMLAEGDDAITNPKTGETFAQSTISRDIKAIEQEWRESARKSIGERIARQLAELAHVKKAAWSKGRYSVVLKAMADERAILGWDGNMDLMTLWREELGDDVTEAEISELFNDFIAILNERTESRTA